MSQLRHCRAPLVGSVRLHRLASGPKAGLGEPVGPLVLLRMHRHAWLDRDRTDLNVTIVNVPSVGAFRVRAADEGGHGPLKRGRRRAANFQSVGCRCDADYILSRLAAR
jgi:hypothetical protein